MTQKKKPWVTVGQIRKSKEGKLYFKVESEVSLKVGDVLQLQQPKDLIERLVKFGAITEEEGENRLARIPEFVKFNVVLPPEQATTQSE